MQILEEYQELIDNDGAEISYVWKVMHVLFYFSCAICGYICSVLFYILQDHVFDGNCPLWAVSITGTRIENDDFDNYFVVNTSCATWWTNVETNYYEYYYACDEYLVTCFLSCIFGVTWFALFLMCGKGGHGVMGAVIPFKPWRIVPPALFFSFIFTIVVIYSNSILDEGYQQFIDSLKDIFHEICTEQTGEKSISNCEVVQSYVNLRDVHDRYVCNLLFWLQGFSAIMTWSWAACFIVLILRTIAVVDFKVLRVRIYEHPNEQTVQNEKVDKKEE